MLLVESNAADRFLKSLFPNPGKKIGHLERFERPLIHLYCIRISLPMHKQTYWMPLCMVLLNEGHQLSLTFDRKLSGDDPNRIDKSIEPRKGA